MLKLLDSMSPLMRVLRWSVAAGISLSLAFGSIAGAHASTRASDPCDHGQHVGNPHCDDPPTATPELSSGDLLVTGLVAAGGVFLYRRSRVRRP